MGRAPAGVRAAASGFTCVHIDPSPDRKPAAREYSGIRHRCRHDNQGICSKSKDIAHRPVAPSLYLRWDPK